VAPSPPRGRAGVGRLALLLAPVLGFVVQARVLDLVAGTWADCAGLARQVSQDLTDDPRFNLPGPYDFGYLLLPVAAALLALYATRRSPGLLAPVLAAAGAALLAALAVAAVDLEHNLTPPRGHYLPAECPDGRPPWLPGFLPARDSGPPNGSVTGG